MKFWVSYTDHRGLPLSGGFNLPITANEYYVNPDYYGHQDLLFRALMLRYPQIIKITGITQMGGPD